MRHARKLGAAWFLSVSAATLLTSPALAVAPDTTFTGNGTSTDWSDAANWDNGVPVNGNNVALTQAGTNAPSVFDINLTAASLTLNTATDATTLANGYVVNNDGTHTFTLQSGGFIEDNAANNAADQLNMGVTLSGPATIRLDSGATGLIIGGAITGTGPLTVTNNSATGTIIFTANNTYTGGTTISAGTLQIGNGGTTGSILGDVVDNGSLVFDRSDNLAYAGSITGTGSVSQSGADVLTLSGTSLYSGGTNINSGTLAVSADANLGAPAGAITIADTATLELAAGFANMRNVTLSGGTATIQTDGAVNAVSTFGGLISGAGGLTKTGGGVLAVTANDTYLGGTTVSAGILSLGAVSSGSTAGMVTGNITDNGTVSFNRTDNLTYANVISGSGGVTKNFGNTLIFTGNNTYAGTTNVAAGTLQLGNGSTTGIVAGNVSLGGTVDPNPPHGVTSFATLDFNRSDDLTFSGAITGLGALVKDNTDTVILTGANFYQSGTTINGGTLQIGNGGTAGSIAGDIAIASGASFVVDLDNPPPAPPPAPQQTVLNLSGVISGGGSLSQIGTGTTVLSGANTYTGGTTISGGTLQIGAGGATGSIVGDVLDNASLVINLNNQVTVLPGPVIHTTPTVLTLAGDITGTGSLSQIGNGTTILTGTDTYSGGTTVSVGTLQIGSGGTAGSITGDVTDTATLAFDRSDAIAFAGNITGTGAVSQIGGGTLTLSGANTYSGGTGISSGILSVASHNNIGTSAISFSNSAVLLLSAGDTFTNGAVLGTLGGTIQTNSANDVWSGAISGAGGLTKDGLGTLALTGSNTYSGGTTVTTGTLQVGNGGVSGAIQGAVTDNATLAFDRSDNPTFSGVISGSGIVEQDGGGTLTLSGTNTYTGGTNINAGAISISTDANLGNGGTVVMAAGTTLKTTATGTFTHAVQVSGDPTFNVASGTTTTWSGAISDGASPPGTVEVTGGGTFKPTNAANSYTGGTVVKGGSTVVIDLDHELGDPTGNLTLGDATTAGTLDIASNLTSGRAMVLAAGGGTVNTEPTITFEMSQPITGAGKLTVSGPGTFVMVGASTYAGGTNVTTGANLQLGDGAALGTVAGNIVDNGTVTLNEAADVAFNGVISGSGALTQSDATHHTVTLTGANTFTGITTIAAGTLQIGNGGTTGSIAGPIVDNDTLAFNRSDSVTIPGAISGTGGVVQAGTGTLILTGNSTYAGSTTINAGGTLQLGNGTSGSIAGSSIVDNGTLAFNRSDAFTVDTPISGTGNVQQNGTGTTILSQNETYIGTTTINAGTLQIGNGGTTGSIQSDITDNGTLAFNRSDNVTYSNVASGTGGLRQAGTGTLTLTGTNTYTGGTTVASGTLQVGNGGTTGTLGAGNVTDNGALVFNRSNTVEVDGAISGTGTLAQNGGGTLILAGANTYAGGTTIVSGSIQIGNGGASGSLAGNVADNGHLVFDRSGTADFTGTISGTGSVVQIGPGVTALTGTNSYTGGTTITAGTLQLGNGGTTGTIAGTIADNGTFAFNRSNALSFGGVISGTGGVNQVGTGTTTLTAANTYTGGTDVNGGVLLVTGSIASSATTVNAGGTLGGTGTVGALTVAAGGVLSPGTGGIGTLNVHGNAAFASNSTFVVDFDRCGDRSAQRLRLGRAERYDHAQPLWHRLRARPEHQCGQRHGRRFRYVLVGCVGQRLWR